MQLDWLEDFIELERTRNFSRAAQNRFVTHPAFGRRIRALEEWSGTPLIQRRQPMGLTAQGMLFLETARDVVGQLERCRTRFSGAIVRDRPLIRIATGRSLASDFFPEWYSQLRNQFGEVTVSLLTSGAQEAIARLSSGDADLVLIFSSPLTQRLLDPVHFETLILDSDELLPLSAPTPEGHPIYIAQNEGPLTPWLGFSPALALHSVLARHLANVGKRLPLDIVYRADSYPAILQMALRGAGLAWLPRMVASNAIAAGELVIAGGPEMSTSFDICLHRLRDCKSETLQKIWETIAFSNAQRG